MFLSICSVHYRVILFCHIVEYSRMAGSTHSIAHSDVWPGQLRAHADVFLDISLSRGRYFVNGMLPSSNPIIRPNVDRDLQCLISSLYHDALLSQMDNKHDPFCQIACNFFHTASLAFCSVIPISKMRLSHDIVIFIMGSLYLKRRCYAKSGRCMLAKYLWSCFLCCFICDKTPMRF